MVFYPSDPLLVELAKGKEEIRMRFRRALAKSNFAKLVPFHALTLHQTYLHHRYFAGSIFKVILIYPIIFFYEQTKTIN